MKLRNGLSGPEGEEVARQRVEDFANKMRPKGLFVRDRHRHLPGLAAL